MERDVLGLHIKAKALEWFLILSLDEPSARIRCQFEVWCSSDRRCCYTFRRFYTLWMECALLADLAPMYGVALRTTPVGVPAFVALHCARCQMSEASR